MGVSGRSLKITVPSLSISAKGLQIFFLTLGYFFANMECITGMPHTEHRYSSPLNLELASVMTLETKHYGNLVRHNEIIACLEESHLYCRVLIPTSAEITSVQNLETPIK